MTRGLVAIVAVLTLLMVGTGAYLTYLGYFGGPVFADARATGGPRRPFAIVLVSGDMGMKVGMGPALERRLRADGYDVVSVNTLTFFRDPRSPAEVTAMLAEAERRALRMRRATHVAMIGQSFGADMMHVGLAGMPADLRGAIAKVVLSVPETTVEFRATPGDLLSHWNPSSAALPTARRLDWVPVLCVQGAEEMISLCPLIAAQPNVRRAVLPGGHPLHRDADLLYATIAQFLAS